MNRGLLAAAGLVIAANIVVLGGVAYNRSRVVQRVELDERELRLAPTNDEDTGVSLYVEYARTHWTRGFDDWLTESKIREAGFDLPAPPAKGTQWRALLPRQVFVAFEIEGDVWRKWQEEERARREQEKTGPVVSLPPTRLIAVDLSRDAESLHRRYPDPKKHLIIRAVIRVSWNSWMDANRQSKEGWRGYLTELLPNSVHVPQPFSNILRPWTRDLATTPRYSVTLCFGARGEPWLARINPL
jgi:hypothetical protein